MLIKELKLLRTTMFSKYRLKFSKQLIISLMIGKCFNLYFRSITKKAEYVKTMNLGGAFLWSIDMDDFNGTCGEKFPLLKTLNRILRNKN